MCVGRYVWGGCWWVVGWVGVGVFSLWHCAVKPSHVISSSVTACVCVRERDRTPLKTFITTGTRGECVLLHYRVH